MIIAQGSAAMHGPRLREQRGRSAAGVQSHQAPSHRSSEDLRSLQREPHLFPRRNATTGDDDRVDELLDQTWH